MSDDLRKELQAEYSLIQGQYEAFDQRALGLKALATPLLGAGVAFGLVNNLPAVIVITIVVALSLWALEVTWKTFQYCYLRRLNALEAWFRGEEPGELQPFQISTWWGIEWRENWSGKLGKQLRLGCQPFVALPYVIVVAAGLVALLFLPARTACAA